METSILGAPNGLNREQCRFLAKVTQTAERYEDMVFFTTRVMKLAHRHGSYPSSEERALLFAAFKGAVDPLRTARRIVAGLMEETAREKLLRGMSGAADAATRKPLQSGDGDLEEGNTLQAAHTASEQKDSNNGGKDMQEAGIDASRGKNMEGQGVLAGLSELQSMELSDVEPLLLYREWIDGKVCGLCRELVKLVDEHADADGDEDEESRAFFLKLKADYLRYIAEVQTGQLQKETAAETLSLYQAAQEIVKLHLPATHVTRLGLALNFSVFYLDIMKSMEIATSLAKEAVKDAEQESKTLDEKMSEDSGVVVGLLQENIKLWSISGNDQGERQ